MANELREAVEDLLEALDSEEVRLQARALPDDLRLSEAMNRLHEAVENVPERKPVAWALYAVTPNGRFEQDVYFDRERVEDVQERTNWTHDSVIVPLYTSPLAPGSDELRWRDAAKQARDDLRRISEEFAEATPPDEEGPQPPIGPGQKWAAWTRPANTIRWIARMEAVDEGRVERVEDGYQCVDCGFTAQFLTRGKFGCPNCHEVEEAT